jgi:hypothetical protein
MMSTTDLKNSVSDGFSFGTSSAEGQFKVAVLPPMADANKEQKFTSTYRGLTLTLTYMPDEDSISPTDKNLPFPVDEERCKAWLEGEWWYFTVLVNTYDSNGVMLDISGLDCTIARNALPSFKDHSYLIQQLCDELVDGLLIAYAETISHDLGVQDQIYEGVSENADGAMAGFKQWIDAESNGEGLELSEATQG